MIKTSSEHLKLEI